MHLGSSLLKSITKSTKFLVSTNFHLRSVNTGSSLPRVPSTREALVLAPDIGGDGIDKWPCGSATERWVGVAPLPNCHSTASDLLYESITFTSQLKFFIAQQTPPSHCTIGSLNSMASSLTLKEHYFPPCSSPMNFLPWYLQEIPSIC